DKGYAFAELAYALLDRGDLKQALALGDRRQGPYWFIYGRAIRHLARRGKYDSAQRLIDKLEAVHWKVGAWLQLASISADAGDRKRAEAFLDQACKLENAQRKPDESSLIRMARLYAGLGNKARGNEVLSAVEKRLASRGKRSNKASWYLAEQLFTARMELRPAKEEIEKAGPADSAHLVRMAAMLAGKGNDELAMKAAAKCQRSHGIWALSRVAVIQAQAGRKVQAQKALQQAQGWLDAVPVAVRNPRFATELALAYAAVGRLDKAESALAVIDAPPSYWAEVAGRTAAEDAPRARKLLAKALAGLDRVQGPYNKAMALRDIAVVRIQLKESAEARKTLARAADVARLEAEKNPTGGCAGLLMSVGVQQKLAGDEAGARASFRQAITFHGQVAVRLREAVTTLAGIGMYSAAVETAGRIPLPSPRQAAYQHIARVQGGQGLEGPAVGWIRKLPKPCDRAFALSGLSGGMTEQKSRRTPPASAPDFPPPATQVEPKQADLLDEIAKRPSRESRSDNNGKVIHSKYEFFRLDEAVAALADVPRPWTAFGMLEMAFACTLPIRPAPRRAKLTAIRGHHSGYVSWRTGGPRPASCRDGINIPRSRNVECVKDNASAMMDAGAIRALSATLSLAITPAVSVG
ncbi:hypothetical protein LCGC14_1991220, partial [marine sediment metagenome]